jgi:hypothetical protein
VRKGSAACASSASPNAIRATPPATSRAWSATPPSRSTNRRSRRSRPGPAGARAQCHRRPARQPAQPEPDHPALTSPGATFVTLTQNGALRGCIGSLQAHRPLDQDVRANAVAAAFSDPRFPPLTARSRPRPLVAPAQRYDGAQMERSATCARATAALQAARRPARRLLRARHAGRRAAADHLRPQSGFCIDPIEKKPLNHFYPGSSVLSFGTAGCNLACKFCQNWDISKSRDMDRLMDDATPQAIARAAQQAGCRAWPSPTTTR